MSTKTTTTSMAALQTTFTLDTNSNGLQHQQDDDDERLGGHDSLEEMDMPRESILSEILTPQSGGDPSIVMESHESPSSASSPWYANPHQISAMISNFSTSYNVVNISLVLPILQQIILLSSDNPNTTQQQNAIATNLTTNEATAVSFAIESIFQTPSRHLQRDDSRYNSEWLQSGASEEDKALVASSLLAGMILGQLLGGILGDVPWLGRLGALRLVMLLQVIASIGSAFCTTLDENGQLETTRLFVQLAAWRFVLGVGAGGVYPLAAVLSAETQQQGSSSEEEKTNHHHHHHHESTVVHANDANDHHDVLSTNDTHQALSPIMDDGSSQSVHSRRFHNEVQAGALERPVPSGQVKDDEDTDQSLHRVVLTFSMQGLGFVAVPLVAILLLYTIPQPDESNDGARHDTIRHLETVWRIIVGLGSLPGIVLMFLQCHLYRQQHQPTLHFGNRRASYIRHLIPTFSPDEEHHVDDEHVRRRQVNDVVDEDNRTKQESTLDSIAAEQDGIFRLSRLEVDNDDRNDVIHNMEDGPQLGLSLSVTSSELVPPPDDNLGWWGSIQHEENLLLKLIGTAGTWFLFDVLFYGNTLFEPIVIEAAFGARSDGSSDNGDNSLHLLQQTALDSLLLTSIALPGYAFAGLLLGKKVCGIEQSPRFVMIQGFGVMSILYMIIGVGWKGLRQFPFLLVVLYGMTFFFANYGPNTTTFVLPSLIYSPKCRTTLNGVSAAAGKFGALVGATLFAPAADDLGDATVMLVCSGIALVALALTKCFVKIPPHGHES